MKAKVFRVVLFFLVIIIIPCFTLFGEKRTVSYNENKTLAEFPKLTVESWKNRSFMNGTADFFSDHFVLRESFIKIKNSIEKVIGKDEINGVVEINGYLVQTFRDYDSGLTDRNIASLNKLKSKNPDTSFYFMPVITAQEMFKTDIPEYYDVDSESEYISYCFDKLKDITPVDISETVLQNDYAFYRTDHHWTTESAYSVYKSIGKILGYAPLKEDNYIITDVTNTFKGTLYSKTLNEDIKSDTITSYKTDTEFVLSVKDKTFNSLFFEDYLSEKDKYSYFLGGNHGICKIINKSLENGKKLLIIKDSYANCLVPFLSEHYSEITLVDPRYCSHIQLRGVNPSDYNEVLVLFNVSGFSSEQNFALIEFMGGK